MLILLIKNAVGFGVTWNVEFYDVGRLVCAAHMSGDDVVFVLHRNLFMVSMRFALRVTSVVLVDSLGEFGQMVQRRGLKELEPFGADHRQDDTLGLATS